MREVTIRDTLSGEPRTLEPGPGGEVGHLCLRADDLRPDPHRQRPPVRGLLAAPRAFSLTRATTPTLVINLTDVNDKIYDAAREAGVPSAEHAERMIAGYVADTDALGIGRPDHEPKATETIGPIVALIEDLIAARPRLRVGRRRLLPGPQLPAYGAALQPRPRGDGPGGGGRRGRAQGGPARLRALEGPQGRRGHRLAEPLGRRPAGLAHRVLGDGRGAARARVRRSTAAAPTSSSPTTRTRSPRPRRRAERPLAKIWMHNGMVQSAEGATPRRCRSRSATSSCSARRSTAFGAEAVVGFLVSGHYRQPIAFGERALEEAAARNERIREFFRERDDRRRASPRPRRSASGARPSSTHSPTTSTPRGRSPSCSR